MTALPEPGPGSGRDLAAVALQVAASVLLYLLVEGDSAKITALRMKLWHYTGRAARRLAYAAGRLGLEAERRYNIVKG